MQVEMLNLSEYDPEMDLIVMYVDVGKMPPQRVRDYLEKVKESVGPLFNKRGFEVLYLPIRDGQPAAVPDIVAKVRERVRDQITNYDDAMKLLGDD